MIQTYRMNSLCYDINTFITKMLLTNIIRDGKQTMGLSIEVLNMNSSN